MRLSVPYFTLCDHGGLQAKCTVQLQRRERSVMTWPSNPIPSCRCKGRLSCMSCIQLADNIHAVLTLAVGRAAPKCKWNPSRQQQCDLCQHYSCLCITRICIRIACRPPIGIRPIATRPRARKSQSCEIERPTALRIAWRCLCSAEVNSGACESRPLVT